MAVEIPNDLIAKLQISLRSQANVPSYDPNDDSLPNLHSLPHSVSDSSLSGVCLHCKAHLLRGPDSLLCIFCGKHQAILEAPPPPIKFKSTSGYRWFLGSLNLDGSEIVGDSLDGNQSNRGSTQEFPLSDLLDLEIRWNDVKQEVFESCFSKNNSSNLAGLDEFLAEKTGDSASKGKFPVNIDIGSTTTSGENLNLFENFQGSKDSGSASSWQADFQSGNSKTDNSPNRSQSSDLTDAIEKKQASVQSGTNDWFQYDMGSSSTSGLRIENANICSSANQGDQGQSIEVIVPSKEITDDSFDTWNDFKGSTSSQDAGENSQEKTAPGMKSMNETSADFVLGRGSGSESSTFESQHEVSKSFDHFAGSSADLSTHMDGVFGTGIDSLQGKAVDNTDTSHATNWFQEDLWSNSISEPVHHAEQSAVDLGDKDGGMLGNLNNTSINVSMIQDDLWPTSRNSVADNATNDEDDDLFGAWNDFKGSGVTNSSISSTCEPANQTNSKEERSSEPLSGWDAYFQSSNFKNQLSDSFVDSSINLSDNVDSVFSAGKGFVDLKAKDTNNVSNTSNWFHDDLWSNSTSKLPPQTKNLGATVNVMGSVTPQSVHNSPSMDANLFSDDKWLTSNKEPDGKLADESNYSFDDWNDFTSSTTAQDGLSNSWKRAAIPDKKTIADSDGLSAAWNDFTSSTSAKHASSSSFKETINHENPSIETSEIQFLGTDSSPHDNSFGSLSQSDFFSGAFSNQNGSSEARISDRMAEATEGEKNTGAKDDDLEILMSQMHDLSFMLESSLSIPAKVDKCK